MANKGAKLNPERDIHYFIELLKSHEVETTDYDLKKKYFRKPEELLYLNTKHLGPSKLRTTSENRAVGNESLNSSINKHHTCTTSKLSNFLNAPIDPHNHAQNPHHRVNKSEINFKTLFLKNRLMQ